MRCVIGAAKKEVMRVSIVTNDSELLFFLCVCWSCSVCVAVMHGLKLDLLSLLIHLVLRPFSMTELPWAV